MQHLTAKKLLPRPVALWHHSFCSNFWCNQTARSKAELTEVLALRSTEHFKAKGWKSGHIEVSGNFATNFNESRISPGEFSKCHFSASTFITRIECAVLSWDNTKQGERESDCGTELKGRIWEVHPGWENEKRAQNCKNSDNKRKERERMKQQHTKTQQVS